MSSRTWVVTSVLVTLGAWPLAGQTPDRVESADRSRPGQASGVAGAGRVERESAVDAGRPGAGRGSGVTVTVRYGGDRADDCRYDDRHRRSGHEWDGRSSRDRHDDWDCDDGLRRLPVRIRDRVRLTREHATLHDRLERQHEQWHRAHGWNPRNRGWHRSHDALHERLRREHERWHYSWGLRHW